MNEINNLTLNKIKNNLIIINLCLLIISFVITSFLVYIFPNNWKFFLAHSTGLIVIFSIILYINWLFPKYKEIYLNKYTTYGYIFSMIGCSGMLIGYLMYIVVHLSPYINAFTSVIFDYATWLSSIISNFFLIKAIIVHKNGDIKSTMMKNIWKYIFKCRGKKNGFI